MKLLQCKSASFEEHLQKISDLLFLKLKARFLFDFKTFEKMREKNPKKILLPYM